MRNMKNAAIFRSNPHTGNAPYGNKAGRVGRQLPLYSPDIPIPLRDQRLLPLNPVAAIDGDQHRFSNRNGGDFIGHITRWRPISVPCKMSTATACEGDQ